jgi:hypothetical protein
MFIRRRGRRAQNGVKHERKRGGKRGIRTALSKAMYVETDGLHRLWWLAFGITGKGIAEKITKTSPVTMTAT